MIPALTSYNLHDIKTFFSIVIISKYRHSYVIHAHFFFQFCTQHVDISEESIKDNITLNYFNSKWNIWISVGKASKIKLPV